MSTSRLESARRWAKTRTNDEQRKIVKFILAGVVRTAAGVGLYSMLCWSGVRIDRALAGEYALVFLAGYVLNRSWTFSDHRHPKATILKYAIAFYLTYRLELQVIELAMELDTGPKLARIPSLVLATVASYLLQRYWVFRGK